MVVDQSWRRHCAGEGEFLAYEDVLNINLQLSPARASSLLTKMCLTSIYNLPFWAKSHTLHAHSGALSFLDAVLVRVLLGALVSVGWAGV